MKTLRIAASGKFKKQVDQLRLVKKPGSHLGFLVKISLFSFNNIHVKYQLSDVDGGP